MSEAAFLQTAFNILWSPAAAAERAGRASLALPLALLAVAGALPSYVLLGRYGMTHLIQLRMNSTPDGLYPMGAFFFSALTWLAPFVLPVVALACGWLLNLYVGFFLDTKTARAEMLRLTAWGFLPLGLQKALACGVELLCDDGCNRFNPLATNAAFLLDTRQTEVFWYELARGMDLFAVWAIAITAIAIGARYQRSTVAVAMGVALLYFVAVLLRSHLVG